MAETEHYVRLTVEQAMAIYGLDREGAETVMRHAYPLCKDTAAETHAINKELSHAGLRERITREVNELITKEGERPDMAWHRTMARVHEQRAK